MATATTTYLHRYARFRADGTGLHWGALCWEGSLAAPVPPHDHSEPGSYVVPMDDRPADWHRLEAEAAVHGHCHHARHSGGTPHPAHAHVRLGGTVDWASDPHPDVTRRVARMQAWGAERLAAHFTGGAS